MGYVIWDMRYGLREDGSKSWVSCSPNLPYRMLNDKQGGSMKKFTILATVLFISIIFGSPGEGLTRDYMMLVGSTTMYAGATPIVERFVKKTGFKVPMVQATGSGGGLMLFCAGVDELDPDITGSSRRIRKSEFATCQGNGVKEIVEVKVGYGGIVLAQSLNLPKSMSLSLKDIYLALAKEVPDPGGEKKLVPNPYKTWKDVNKILPNLPIKVLGPSAGSGTRSVFTKLAMGGGCASFDWLRALRKEDMLEFKTVSRTIREDGAYIPASESDDQTIKHLATNLDTIAILSFGTLDRHQDKIRALAVEGITPDFNTIADESYPITRPLYLYVKKAHVDKVPGIREFLDEITSEQAWSKDGYLIDYGLIPMPPEERKKYRGIAKNLTPMTAGF